MGDEEVLATPNGLLQCLRMLVEEASVLRLERTFAALQDAVDICNSEASARTDLGGIAAISFAIH